MDSTIQMKYVYQRQDRVESDEMVQIWKEAKRAASSAPYTVHQGDGGRLENNCKTWEGELGGIAKYFHIGDKIT